MVQLQVIEGTDTFSHLQKTFLNMQLSILQKSSISEECEAIIYQTVAGCPHVAFNQNPREKYQFIIELC